MLEITQNFLIRFENILGALLCLIGTGGSYIRYAKYQRKKREDILFLVCITWGSSLLALCFANVYKDCFVPTFHIEIARVIYYSVAFVTSLIFFAKNAEQAKARNLVATFILAQSFMLFFIEGAVFYLDMPYQAAFISSLGVLFLYYQFLIGRSNLLLSTAACTLILLPIIPKISQGSFDLEKMEKKRTEYIQKNQSNNLP